MANDKSYVEKSPLGDPLVLGVSVPLTITKAKATEVATAWKSCFVELLSAAKTKYIPEKPVAKQTAPSSSQPTISA
jgi:hypothetical protein